MRPTALKLTAGLMLFCGLSSSVKAQTDPINVVTTAVPFLRISPDARSGGMGELGIATSADVYSGLWNGGKVAFNQSRGGVGATYTPWLKDIVNDVYLANLAGYFKIDDEGNSAIFGSLRYFSLGNITFTDNLGNDFGSFRPREFGVDVGYSRKLGSKSGIGVALKYINSNLAGGTTVGSTTYKTGSAVAADLSYYHNGVGTNGSGWSWGAVMSNLGSKISYTDNADAKDFIPANLGLGANYTKKFNATNRLSLGLELNKLLVPTPPAAGDAPGLAEYRSKGVVGSWFSSFGDAPDGFAEELKEFTISTGAEYTYNDQFSLRAGYFYENQSKGNRRYATAGLGVKYNMFQFNFAYLVPTGAGVNRNPLSNTLRFSVTFDFGKKKSEGVVTQLPTPVPEVPVAEKKVQPTPPPTPAPTPKPTPASTPEAPKDTDGDGITDDKDRCPRTPGIASNRGCPELILYYSRDVDDLNAADEAELDKAVNFLRNNPELTVVFEGHASTLGGSAYNQGLSERRAAKAKDYCVSKGIAANRITTAGFGERFPIGDQKTEEGRSKSRRVVVKINF